MMKIFATLLTFGFLFLPFANATEIYENWQSARAMGVGNAFTTMVDDKDALFYNPAGLDKIKGVHLSVLDPAVGTDALNAYTLYQSVTGTDYATAIREFYGVPVWVGVSDSLAVSFRDFAICAYDFANISFNLHNPAYSNLTLSTTNDMGITGGLAANLLPLDIFRLGFSIKRVTRFGGRLVLGPSTLATLSNTEISSQLTKYGSGYGINAGMLIEIPVPSHPTLSAVWEDIGQTKFTPIVGTTAPPPMDNNAVAGFGFNWDFNLLKIRPAFEFRHINMQEEALAKRLHMGLEIWLLNIALRGGANQGYYTLGAGIDLMFLRIDAATYGVELDTYAGQLEDRRYIVQVTLDLNLDPSFAFGNGENTGHAHPSNYQRR